MLKQGVDIWNAWKEQNPDIEIDLSDVYLGGVELCNSDLIGADLERTGLSGMEVAQLP